MTDAAVPVPSASPVPTRSHLHPAYIDVAEKRASDIQLKIADGITRFAGSMTFVYVHIVVFAVWMLLVEKNPWPTLTLTVSLEAIFLSTFVMIGQNRAAAYQQAKADHDFMTSESELRGNTELIKSIHHLTVQLHNQVCNATPPVTGASGEEPGP